MTAEDFSFPNHVPGFLDEVLAGASPEVVDVCGSDSMCIFDATQTGDLAIGIETMTLIETDLLNREIVGKSFPTVLEVYQSFLWYMTHNYLIMHTVIHNYIPT